MTVLRVNTIAGTGTTFGPTLEGNLEFNSQNYIVLPKGSSTQEGVLRTTADVVGTGGTFYDNLVLAMPFNAATGLTDVSSRNRNPAAYGNVAISTAQSKYYGSSAFFNNTSTTGNYLSVSSADFAMGTGNFTVEGWIYQTAGDTTYGGMFSTATAISGGTGIVIARDLCWLGSGTAEFTVSGTFWNLNEWTHIAFVRNGSVISVFRNGVLVGSTSGVTSNIDRTIAVIGRRYSDIADYAPTGYLQDLRIYKGLAKYTANFTPPERIAEIGVGFKAGQLRYNTDSNKVELYDGNQWTEVQASRPDLNGGARGVFGGGYVAPAVVNTIDFITISSTGNATDFGDLTQARYSLAACSSSTRGVFGGGYLIPALVNVNTIDFITISSTGNATDFGDLTQARLYLSACSSSTRGVFGGGATVNTIDFITISSTGNATDFGDLTQARYTLAACSSSTRGVFGGGYTPATVNTIDFITISSTGNATDFGDLTQVRQVLAACSSSTRGVFGGGYAPTNVNTIDFITISTTGNSSDFGDLTQARHALAACSSSTRGVFGGGVTVNTIDFITISSTGNATDFGDLTQARRSIAACSNGHGGL